MKYEDNQELKGYVFIGSSLNDLKDNSKICAEVSGDGYYTCSTPLTGNMLFYVEDLNADGYTYTELFFGHI